MPNTDRFLDPATWAAVRLPVEQASTLPAECYADGGFFALEQQRVFAGGWVGVGFADEVAGAGRTITRLVAGRSIIITTNRSGELRGFLNSCRHRGTELVETDCVIDGIIRCPYHRWGYDLDGTLVATPTFDEVPLQGFDRADFGLHPVLAESFAGVLWVSLDPTVAPIQTCFGDLETRLGGYQLDRWRLRETADIAIEANWKLISENFQEYYHLHWVHPDLAKVSRVGDHYRYQGRGQYCGQTTTPVSGDTRDDWTALPAPDWLSASDAASGRFLALFPNVLLSILPNHVFIMVLDPLEPGRTLERTAFLLPDIDDGGLDRAAIETSFANTRSFWFDVNNEDVDIVERGQRGLTHGGFTPGRLSPRFEEPLHRYYNMLADRFLGQHRIPDGDPADDCDLYGSGVNPLPYRPTHQTS
jgi:phenylpropionate dioxygenase-like ring-hydroxylating dioxygenase large terminal subunit